MNLSLCLLLTVAAGSAEPPRVFTLDGARLLAARAAVKPDDPALTRLRAEADKALAGRPPSVMDKTIVPPSGDKHDYMSMGPYWWPDPAKPDGKPYIRRDGEVNPESRDGAGTDTGALGRMASSVATLALAWYLTGHEPYADRAVELLRVWFLDPATRMNPNLNYGQAIPGITQGRGIGIIDTTSLVPVADALGLLEGARAFTPELRDGLVTWFGAYLKWLRDSRNGQEEARTTNNHRTWYMVQVASMALLTGDTALAKATLEGAKAQLAHQIQPDGRQPEELARTNSFGYSGMNLTAWFNLAEIGRHADVDLYGYHTDDGRGIRAALDYLLPYIAERSTWPHEQIKALKGPDEGLAGLVCRAARLWPDGKYAERVPPMPSARWQLCWGQ
ncbi:MAG: alginate lyase family protein [Armatimonadetes bacterium]|nr:alginate lyase family protein [Armatimonadota bacterium]